ncbi:SLBB domain-containing protein [Prevotella sp. P3-122]|uniref:SLBB domain-containing protein n=1 Tax=Prevotella sp. P3-122 TaxID=2024223 RepID=UPI000B95F110|nr:SLBB domain-containing protein [Prevotella sp. P3-122]MCI6555307.1 SLBB domain-containing protein [Prevotella sp.]MCI7340475.1 SLBB domain-containing protein [Prevotella sp.]MCI7688717.1 SLBB domain-containing protein [Prevotella sp.]MDD6591023.1 SLBB domain-containing protein [Prevotella sp.]OYP59025.1 capsule biosynthesis protein [Prevotella sp. P3-122]
MKRNILSILLLIMCPLLATAQSSMTDDQLMQFVIKEHNAGTSQQQIVTKLMQRGVDIQQIRRVKAKYERQIKQSGLGNVADKAVGDAETRMRQNNGKTKDSNTPEITTSKDAGTSYHIQDITTWQQTYDENSEDFIRMQAELGGLLPTDSIEWLNQLLKEKELDQKKVFGRDIFNNKELTFEPNMNIATPQNYKLGPGDAVFIDIYGASQKTIEGTISPDGEITIDGFGPVHVSGLTVAQANSKLRSTLGARYSSSQIKLTVGQTKTIMVNVMGEVKVPGTYTLSAFATVFHALYMAGGTNELGTLRSIKVYRNNKLVTVVDIYDYILNGKLTGNIRLADNDVIVVGPYDCLVNITGKVKRPMYYEMKRNESLSTLLKYSGGFAGDAYTKSVRVVRKTGQQRSVFNIEEFDMASFHVSDGDSVSVDSILPRYENTVELKGAVFRPGLYQLGNNINSVRSLIEHAEGITEEAFTNRAVMHRMKADRTLEVVSVDLAGILNGTSADIPLKENDVLFVPTKQDAMVDRTITIHGEVHYPGIYKYADNETIEDFILQAGGLRESASMVKVDVARRVSDPKATVNDSIIARTYSFAIKDGFVVDGTPGFTLMPFDEVYVRKSPGYSAQQNIKVEGQAMFPGTYTLSMKNERLSDILKKAGGVTDLAYTPGARLERRITPDEKLRMQTITNMLNSQSGNDSLDIKKLDLGNTYYVGIELDKAIAEPGGDADIVLREGDRLIIPEYNGTVKISGDVMYPNTVAYEKGKRASYYIDQAGGWGDRAKKSNTYIIYMNGTVAKVGHNAKIMPGCEIVVPSKPKKDARTLAQILTIGTSVASLATMIATIANIVK